MQWDTSDQAGFTKADKPWLPVNENYLTGINVADQSQASEIELFETSFTIIISGLSQPSESLQSCLPYSSLTQVYLPIMLHILCYTY